MFKKIESPDYFTLCNITYLVVPDSSLSWDCDIYKNNENTQISTKVKQSSQHLD